MLRIPLAVRQLSLQLLWDLFMVWVALINLSLIVFDLSYFLCRPLYHHYLPPVTRVYDRLKGIEPHPLTTSLAEEVATAEQLLALDPGSERLAGHLEALRRITARVLLENPFERAGRSADLEVIRRIVAEETDRTTAQLAQPTVTSDAVREFWTAEPVVLRYRLQLFQDRVVPRLELNYHREFDYSGHLVDHFWIVDLPFLILFWVEFVVRWLIALKRRTYARWFFFPIFNWYDLIGLIPNGYFRLFRLLRAVSMYMRLRRSGLSRVGKDIFSRAVAYISNIITEEVSDMVSLRILNEYQEEIRDGTHRRIIAATIGSRRSEIEQVLAAQIGEMLTDPATLASLRELFDLNLATAVEQAEALRSIPLPAPIVKPVVRAVGQVILDTTLESVTMTLSSDAGRRRLQELVASIWEQIAAGPGLDEVEELGREISLDVLEHMKRAVAVKKWALPKTTQQIEE